MRPELVKGRLFYHINLVGRNGEIMFTSETYYSRSNAERAYLRILRELDEEEE